MEVPLCASPHRLLCRTATAVALTVALVVKFLLILTQSDQSHAHLLVISLEAARRTQGAVQTDNAHA